ncbi:MAG: DUF1592 domain-containing protein [Polyangiales bacterium]
MKSPPRSPLLLCSLSLALSAACTGQIGDRPSMPGDGAVPFADGAIGADGATQTPSFRCDPQQVPEDLPLRRLGRTQYLNALDNVVRSVNAGIANDVRNQLSGLLARFPEDHLEASADSKHGGYTSADQVVQQQHLDVTYDIATSVGQQLTRDASRITQVFGACATDGNAGNDGMCLDAFLDSFGARALRRPLTAEDRAFYKTSINNSVAAADLADLVALILTAPQFLYHVEHGDTADGRASQFVLGPWELAARLSFHFWQQPPDEALRESARSGELATEAGYARQVQRLFDDPRTESSLDRFFREYLWLDTLPSLNARNGDAAFDAFRGSVMTSSGLRTAMIDDVLGAARYSVRRGETFAQFFTNRRSFARDATLAAIYETPAWDGMAEPPMFTQPQRAGLLTRAAFLSTGTVNTRPIMKGVFIRLGMLCDVIPAPPANAAATPIPMLDGRTTRQVVEALTEAPGTPCAGCHTTLINPLGFASENFDALGRVRAQQTFYNSMGMPTGMAPIDTRSVPLVSTSDPRPSQDAVDLSRMLVESNRMQACFARQYFRHTFGRLETLGRDDCALQRLNDAALAGRPLAEVLRAIALDPAFRTRNFQ